MPYVNGGGRGVGGNISFCALFGVNICAFSAHKFMNGFIYMFDNEYTG